MLISLLMVCKIKKIIDTINYEFLHIIFKYLQNYDFCIMILKKNNQRSYNCQHIC